jgi:hypothetical protein
MSGNQCGMHISNLGTGYSGGEEYLVWRKIPANISLSTTAHYVRWQRLIRLNTHFLSMNGEHIIPTFVEDSLIMYQATGKL